MPDYIRVPLSQGKFALISPEDADRVLAFKWSAFCPKPKAKVLKWYAVRGDYSGGKRKQVYLHRFIMEAEPGIQVDHKNGDGLDCQRENLRSATSSQNRANVAKRNGRSAYKGVRFDARDGKWFAVCHINGVTRRSSYVATEIEAAHAYDVLALEMHGEFASLNFPLDARDAA